MGWHKTRYRGIRYRKHTTRKHGVQFDKYYVIYYKVKGRQHEEAVGWSSDGLKIDNVVDILAELKRNHRSGRGPQTLGQIRDLEEAKRHQKLLDNQRWERENISFSHFFNNNYLPISRTNKKPETVRKEIEHFKNWLEPVLGDIINQNIVPLNLERIKRNLLDKGRSPRLIQYVMATFRQCWNIARRDGFVVGDSPTKQVRLPRIDNNRERFLTHEEADSLLEAVKKRSLQCYFHCLLSLHSGMRAGEIFGLKWGDVDISRGILTVRGKGDRSRSLIMTQSVKEMFESFGGDAPDQLVFVDELGNRIVKISNSFHRSVDELGLNAGITDRRQKIVFHSLRHTHASWHVESGTDLYVVQKILGHATPSMTMRYSHLGESTLAQAQQRFELSINKPKIETVEVSDDATVGLA